MAEKQDERGHGAGVVILLTVIVLILPVAYVLSTGPASWLDNRGYITEGGAVWMFYEPIRWLNENCPPFSSFIGWYTSFFDG